MHYPVLDAKATGARIKELRKEQHLKVEDVARFMGFETAQAIYKWQRGDSLPTVDNLYALSRLFNTSVDDILRESREKDESPSLCFLVEKRVKLYQRFSEKEKKICYDEYASDRKDRRKWLNSSFLWGNNSMNVWIPSIEVESSHGTREVSLSTRHLMNRVIFLNGSIDHKIANDFLSQFIYLEQESDKPITIIINSQGGEVNAGLLIYDTIQGSTIPINMICAGLAASMAAILLAGGHKGRRYILKHSKVMIHEPLLSSAVGGSATSIKNISESILETKAILNNILSEHTGKTLEEINQATRFDNYMNAEEAIEFGICDKVTKSVLVWK